MRPEGMSPVELFQRIAREADLSRVRRPWAEVDWASARIEFRNPIPMESTPMENLLAGLPDASGTFTGYFDTETAAQYFTNMFHREALEGPNYFDFRDACSPDVSQPYPF